MDNREIRLRIVEAVIPVASRVEISTAEKLVDKCREVEDYVMGPQPTAGTKGSVKNSQPRRGRQSKGAKDGNKQSPTENN